MPVHRSAPFLAGVTGAFLVGVCGPVNGQDKDGGLLYLDNCAGCHGLNLEGQPDWRQRLPSGGLPAPPHDTTGHTWHHSDRQLFQIVKEGPASIMPGYETDMPGFGWTLSDGQITAILDYIKSTWPRRQQEIQASRSAADPQQTE